MLFTNQDYFQPELECVRFSEWSGSLARTRSQVGEAGMCLIVKRRGSNSRETFAFRNKIWHMNFLFDSRRRFRVRSPRRSPRSSGVGRAILANEFLCCRVKRLVGPSRRPRLPFPGRNEASKCTLSLCWMVFGRGFHVNVKLFHRADYSTSGHAHEHPPQLTSVIAIVVEISVRTRSFFFTLFCFRFVSFFYLR